MLSKINRAIQTVTFIVIMAAAVIDRYSGNVSNEYLSIIIILCNIGLLLCGEVNRRTERDKKEDAERRNANETYGKTILHG